MFDHDNRYFPLEEALYREQSEHVVDGGKKFALVILNGPLGSYTRSLFRQATYTVCADGGCNQLFDFFNTKVKPKDVKDTMERDHFIPNVIVGDFDSARPEVLEYYKSKGSDIQHVRDQNTTDMQKALAVLLDSLVNLPQGISTTLTNQKYDIDAIIVYGAFGGRFDHEMGNINVLYKYSRDIANRKCTELRIQPRLCLLSEGNFSELLCAGKHEIRCHATAEKVGTHCGLLPIGGECLNVFTNGLTWNLQGDSMAFGGLVSSCNVINSTIVEVTTSHPLLWTTSCGELTQCKDNLKTEERTG